MTKKDYKLFAASFGRMLATSPNVEAYDSIMLEIDRLGVVFTRDNPRFDMARFKAATILECADTRKAMGA